MKRASRLNSRTPSLRVFVSCMWMVHTLVSQPHPCSHILRSIQGIIADITNGEHQKKLRAICRRKSQEAKSRPIGKPILQSPATPSRFVIHAARRTQRNKPFARWRIRPPGLCLGFSAPLSAKCRDLSRAAGLQSLWLTSLKDKFKLCLV